MTEEEEGDPTTYNEKEEDSDYIDEETQRKRKRPYSNQGLSHPQQERRSQRTLIPTRRYSPEYGGGREERGPSPALHQAIPRTSTTNMTSQKTTSSTSSPFSMPPNRYPQQSTPNTSQRQMLIPPRGAIPAPKRRHNFPEKFSEKPR